MPRGSELTTPCSFWGRWDSGAEGQHAGVGGCEDLGMGETNSSAPRSVRYKLGGAKEINLTFKLRLLGRGDGISGSD